MLTSKFFDSVRDSDLFHGHLSQRQVNTLNSIDVEFLLHDNYKPREAYIMATAYREAGQPLVPIVELGEPEYFLKYEPGTRLGKVLGNLYSGDGFRFRGRGLVQITGRALYFRVGQKIGIDLIANPGLALTLPTATRILDEGMLKGWFTGVELSQFIDTSHTDFYNARKVVNGLDHAAEIAAHAEVFQKALEQE